MFMKYNPNPSRHHSDVAVNRDENNTERCFKKTRTFHCQRMEKAKDPGAF
jgi:hypothetical protein